MLTAAGFPRESLLFRDARKPNWHRGLDQTVAVVCDCLSQGALPETCRAIPFPLLSESAIAELRKHVEFIQNPLVP
jgi:hypothetical protein